MSTSMHSSYISTAPGQLHTTLSGPSGAPACLTIYDVCPHTSHSTDSHLSYGDPYLHYDLPLLPTSSSPRTIEYVDDKGRKVIETTSTALTTVPEPRYTTVECVGNKQSGMSNTRSTLPTLLPYPQDRVSNEGLARLVLSKHSPTMHHIRESTAAPLPRSILKNPAAVPTIYLLTFSTDRTPTTRAFAALLNEHLPYNIPLRYTIDARGFLAPPTRICENYSGVAAIVQDEVLRDAGARREIAHAVEELVIFMKQGGRATGIAVCCTAGTHRSVTIAEMIALGVRKEIRRLGSEEGVKVVVRHVHRIKGPKDPY